MNLPKIAAALLAASPAWAAYSYFFTDNLASLNTINWSQAGTVTGGNGLADDKKFVSSRLCPKPIAK